MTTVTGASNNLIEINGDLIEEFDAYDCNDGRMALSDGTLLKVEYDEDSLWRFKVLYKGSLYDHKDEGSADEGINDVVHFKPGIKWAVFSEKMQIASYSVVG